jgi:hypothetical protein
MDSLLCLAWNNIIFCSNERHVLLGWSLRYKHFTVVITYCLTVTKYPFLKWQWIFSLFTYMCLSSITFKTFTVGRRVLFFNRPPFSIPKWNRRWSVNIILYILRSFVYMGCRWSPNWVLFNDRTSPKAAISSLRKIYSRNHNLKDKRTNIYVQTTTYKTNDWATHNTIKNRG